jgi:L-malate glycosyltransferase
VKVLLLGSGDAIHTQRWANGLADAGVRVLCVSQHPFMDHGWLPSVERLRLRVSGQAGYFMNAPQVARLYRHSHCSLLNAHYATGYGMLAMLSGVQPCLVSVWGSDVFDFPRRSPLHRSLVRQVLSRCEAVASTSEVMAHEVRTLMGAQLRRPITLTPFGVDTRHFVPASARERQERSGPLVIGTVKTLAPKYGIDTLLRAFARLLELIGSNAGTSREPPRALRLRILGEGPQRAELQALAVSLGIAPQVEFVGYIRHEEVVRWLQGFDVFVAASRLDSESFGVAVVEASACGLPVIVTRVGGLPEVVSHGHSGLVVEKDDPQALAQAMARLVADRGLRELLGEQGRRWVQQRYEWRDCVRTMLDTYRRVLATTPALRRGNAA